VLSLHVWAQAATTGGHPGCWRLERHSSVKLVQMGESVTARVDDVALTFGAGSTAPPHTPLDPRGAAASGSLRGAGLRLRAGVWVLESDVWGFSSN
jgi:hypothetical protein